MELFKFIVFDKLEVFDDIKIFEEFKFKFLWVLIQKIIIYFVVDELVNSKCIIDKGESDMVEFKEFIDKYYCDKIIQIFFVFMNLNGGIVFCGVDDEGKIIGLDVIILDIDNFKCSIISVVQCNFGFFFVIQLFFDIEKIDDYMIFWIDMLFVKLFVFYCDVDKKGNEQEVFYIWMGFVNIKIKKSSEIIKYIGDCYCFVGQQFDLRGLLVQQRLLKVGFYQWCIYSSVKFDGLFVVFWWCVYFFLFCLFGVQYSFYQCEVLYDLVCFGVYRILFFSQLLV